jgi:hypothetical protein
LRYNVFTALKIVECLFGIHCSENEIIQNMNFKFLKYIKTCRSSFSILPQSLTDTHFAVRNERQLHWNYFYIEIKTKNDETSSFDTYLYFFI